MLIIQRSNVSIHIYLSISNQRCFYLSLLETLKSGFKLVFGLLFSRLSWLSLGFEERKKLAFLLYILNKFSTFMIRYLLDSNGC